MEIDYTAYPRAVVNGDIIASRITRLACQRFLMMMEREDMQFIPEKVDKIVKFIGKLKHWEGSFAGKPFVLSDWQVFIIAQIYGFYWKKPGEYDDNTRVCRRFFLEIPRKNGKSSLIAALSLAELIISGESGGQVCVLANSAKQAGILFNMAKQYISMVDAKHKVVRPYRDHLYFGHTNSILQVLPAEAERLDGWNPSCYIIDEFEEALSDEARQKMATGQGARLEPLEILICTAGSNQQGPCYAKHENLIKILEGSLQDDSQYGIIYSLDDQDDYRDPKVWKKANPNLGVSLFPHVLQDDVNHAQDDTITLNRTLQLRFNRWSSGLSTWLPVDVVKPLMQCIDINEYRGCEATLAFDLASNRDIAALSLCMNIEGVYRFLNYYFLPEGSLVKGVNAAAYQVAKAKGHLIVTPGRVLDYDEIFSRIKILKDIVYISKVSYDRWNATDLVKKCESIGLNCQPYAQSVKAMNAPLQLFERSAYNGKLIIDNNPLNLWCISNVVLQGQEGAYKPVKKYKDSPDKIDGVVAMLMALGAQLDGEGEWDNTIVI